MRTLFLTRRQRWLARLRSTAWAATTLTCCVLIGWMLSQAV